MPGEQMSKNMATMKGRVKFLWKSSELKTSNTEPYSENL